MFFTGLNATHAASLHVTLSDEKTGKPLPYVVVSLYAISNKIDVKPLSVQIMDQVGKAFIPHVLPVTVGTSVSFPNSDDIRHHLYSFDKPKPFELPLYEGTPTQPIVFDKKGIVRLGCNIHDWMMGYIYIVDTPFFALSDGQGKLSIDGLPAGEYSMHIWHPRIKNRKAMTMPVVFAEYESKGLSQTVAVRKTRKMKKRPRSRRDGY